ncbi:MAG: outer membrane beta-barrel protein [Hyphomicrobiaceae bacterium]
MNREAQAHRPSTHGGRYALWLIALSVSAPLGLLQARATSLRSDVGNLYHTQSERRLRDFWDESRRYGAAALSDIVRDHVEPEGIRFGNYIILPSGEARLMYETNPDRAERSRGGDASLALTPRLQALSRFGRHALNFDVGGTFKRYLARDEYDADRGFATVEGALHIDHAHTLSFALMTDYSHVNRLDLGIQEDIVEDTAVWRNGFEMGLTRDAGRLAATIGVALKSYDFFDVRRADGTILNQDDRDAIVASSDLKLSYRFSPALEFQSRLKASRTFRPRSVDFDRDSWGLDGAVGFAAQLSPLWRVSLLAGYGFRDFDDPRLSTEHAAIFDAEAKWLVTETLNLTFGASRSFGDEWGGRSVLRNIATIGLEYEAYNNMIFTINGLYGYEMSEVTKAEAVRWGASLELKYLHSKHLHFGAGISTDEKTFLSDKARITDNRIWFSTKVLY